MTEINYLIGKTVSSRHNLLERKMLASGKTSFLHIVPTKGRVMELETDPLFWLGRHVNTLTGIIHRIFEEDIKPERYADYSPVDQIVKNMLIKKALVNRANEPHGLSYLNTLFSCDNPDKDYPGIFRNICGFFSTLYRNNYEDIYANDLGGKISREEEKEPGSAAEKYSFESDLLWLMGDYEELKREIKGYDEDDVFRDVRDYLKEKQTSYITDFDVIILDSLVHISRIEEDILCSFINSVEELWWLIDYDSNGDDPITEFIKACGREGNKRKLVYAEEGGLEAYRIYYSLISLMNRLHQNGISYKVERADDAIYPNPYAEAIYTNIDIDINARKDSLKIGSFPSEVDEVRAIASEIKSIISQEGQERSLSPGDIRVIFPDLNNYASLVSEIFVEYGIPFSLTKGIPLSSHPLSNIFLKIFQLPIGGFLREDLFSLFSLKIISMGLLHFKIPHFSLDIISEEHYLPGDTRESLEDLLKTEVWDENIKKPDIHIFDTVMSKNGINFLGKELENINDDQISIIRDIYCDRISGAKDPYDKISLRVEFYLFLYQRIIFKLILSPFITLAQCKTPEKVVEAYGQLIHLLGFPLNILEINNRDIGIDSTVKRGMLKRDIRAFSILKELLNTSYKEINLARRLFDIKNSDSLLSLFYKTFTTRIYSKYLLDERNPDVVRVSQWLETRGRSFEYVFAGGLTSGNFPLKEESDFIIPESSRGLFRKLDPIDYSKYLFSNLLKNYKKRLYLSYPENISEKPVQPSQVIRDLYALEKTDQQAKPPHNNLCWKKKPFYTSSNDLLNTGKKKNAAEEINENIYLSNLKNIVIKDSSSEEDIIRGIKTLVSRSAVNGLFEYDGQVGNASEFKKYTKERSNIFSSSRLETMANCPMKYIFKYVYNITDPGDIAPEADSRDIGQLVHDILNMFFKELKELKNNVAGLGLKQASNILRGIINNHLENKRSLERLDFGEFHKQELFSGLYSETGSDGITDNREGIITALLRYENSTFIKWLPAGVEYEFGAPDKPVQMGNVNIKGYIDRFDKDIDSPETYCIYDYKTGNLKPAANIKKGLAFQLPVYIRALDTILKPGEISAAFYSLKRNAFLENAPLKSHVNFHSSGSGIDISGVTLIDEFIIHLAGLIDKGTFHHSADRLTCKYCTFKYACHKNERRMEYLLEACPDLDIYSGDKNFEKWQIVDAFRKEWKKICQSMEKAETLKTESARKKHYETVNEFYHDLVQRRDSLPFTAEYMGSLIDELNKFQNRYSSS